MKRAATDFTVRANKVLTVKSAAALFIFNDYKLLQNM